MVVLAELLSAGATLRRARATLAQARRDAAMVGLTLRGGVPAPTIPRRATLASIEPGAALRNSADRARAVRVTLVTRETRDAVTLELEDPSGDALDHVPGQFFTVLVPLAGETLRRAYSISTGPGERVAITVKRLDGGRVSSHLVETARAGDMLRVLGPSGSFGDGLAHATHLVVLAGGSGITPIASIAKHALARGVRVSLVYGNRSEEDVIFQRALARLASGSAGLFDVRHVLERPGGTLDTMPGRLDREGTARALDALAVRDDATTFYLVCGPTPMMDAVRAELLARGVPGSRIREELFVRPELRKEHALAGAPPAEVTVRAGGKTYVARAARGQSVLDAALAAGAPMPFSCTMGGCGACKVRLVSGSVDVEEPSCLSGEERARGEVLTCVGHATSDCTLEVP